MMKRRVAIPVAVALAIGVVATVLVSSASGRSDQSLKGGTYRVGWESSFGWTNSFDPTGEYLANAFAINTNLLLRGLVNYNHVAGNAGAVIVPDLATKVPKPTNGGRRYTFKLKSGVKWAPPLNREITAQDVKYAVERVAKPANGAQYAGYYNVIKGWDALSKGKAKSLAGVKTPNAKTVVFDLTKPTGDFLMRLGLPAVFPMPMEVAGCFDGKPGAYGRYVVGSGPYMIEGTEDLDIGSCKSMKPISGYDGQTKLTLVRNPNYNAKTDSRKSRENNPDRFEFTVDSNIDDIYNKVAAGDLDDEYATASPKVFREYSVNPSKRKYLHSDWADGTYYITMNLTQPPFDDVHVRKAMNWIVDRNALTKAWGGAVSGVAAGHVIPPTVLGAGANYYPYKTPGDHGSLAKAKAEMAKSKYATANGVCTAKECKGVLLITDVRAVDKLILPVVQSNAAKIGITFTARQVNGAYPVIQTTSKNIPISTRPRWFKDFADASTFIGPLFYGGNIIPSGNTNYSLVGLKPSQLKSLGVTGSTKNVPSIDKMADKCGALPLGKARTACYGRIDKVLTTEIVPWVPYMWAKTVTIISKNVTKWNFDQNSGFTALAHVAVKS